MVIFHYSHSIYISLIFFVDLKFIQGRDPWDKNAAGCGVGEELARGGDHWPLRRWAFQHPKWSDFHEKWDVLGHSDQICFWCVLEEAGMSKKTIENIDFERTSRIVTPSCLDFFSRSIHQQTPPKEVRFACFETLVWESYRIFGDQFQNALNLFRDLSPTVLRG